MDSILLTHAQVAVSLAGFASVAAVLQRPLSPVQRSRFITILFLSLLQILGGLVPVWLSALYVVDSELWRTTSALYLVASLVLGLVLLYPLRALGGRGSGMIVMNVSMTVIVWLLYLCAFGTLLVNLFASPAPGFVLYYASLIAGMITVFIAFADVATRAAGE